MADFPPVGVLEDSSFHTMERADTVLRDESEGGYELTRPITTRRPSRIYTTGFTELTSAQKSLLEDFEEDRSYGALSFEYNVPSEEVGTTLTIRVKIVGTISWTYTGVGPLRRWKTGRITLREV